MTIRKLLTTTALIALAAMPALAADDLTKPAGKDWPAVGGDWNNSRYSTLDKINTGNVKTLGGAWVKQFEGAYSRITPVVVDGMMFVTAGPYVYALNPATGEEIWKTKPDVPASMLFKSVAVGEGKVFVGTADASIFALDAKIDEWITKPMALVPGTKMAFLGVSNPAVRANIIAYLKQATQ